MATLKHRFGLNQLVEMDVRLGALGESGETVIIALAVLLTSPDALIPVKVSNSQGALAVW